ncbi:hypothetical protein CY34DRAFT_226505 [Suillus luteus UH-Slu-Lm8-n1]|uniref:Uncharacterized protein n=1 Tax=Suillus luteus UH-Slu-Lm8-n1 TaxID=930992 RepID=A0A0D0AH09_9AGAM|nr:hypothetical protein CY34DRAFT_226505 [Suillus luteus UH-Slu-Lm8-n1]
MQKSRYRLRGCVFQIRVLQFCNTLYHWSLVPCGDNWYLSYSEMLSIKLCQLSPFSLISALATHKCKKIFLIGRPYYGSYIHIYPICIPHETYLLQSICNFRVSPAPLISVS